MSTDVGLAGVRGATLAGAAGGALEWFNFAPTVSLSGVAAGIATVNVFRTWEEELLGLIC